MIQFCVMAGHEGMLQPDKKVYLTLFGGCDLRRPTFARQLLAHRQRQASGEPLPGRHTFVTICGGVEIKSPTLAEEFVDLRELLSTKALRAEDWDAFLADPARYSPRISAFTLMGGFEEVTLPSENEEVESLAIQQHVGNISENVARVLKYGVGQRDAERWATLRKALATAGL